MTWTTDGGDIAPVIFVPPDSDVLPLARTVAWLWRLGPLMSEPDADAVGMGSAAEAGRLEALVRERRLRAAVVLAGEEGPGTGSVPERSLASGVASFATGERVEGSFVVFRSGRPAVTSSLGTHAVREDGLLVAGADATWWGQLEAFWLLPALADFLSSVLERPLVMLPPVGCLRLDDVPGTAEQQLRGSAKGDVTRERRIERLVGSLEAARARLVVAVAARALDGERAVPLDEVWPRAVAALRGGVEQGVLEPACHGLLHLDTAAWQAGTVDPREFRRLDRDEAGARLDEALAWLRRRLGEPGSFIAPVWDYGPGALAAARERSLPAWLPPTPGPLLREGGQISETLADGLPGLHGLDYAPLERLAAAGLPPTVVFHGWLLDNRLAGLRPRDLPTLVRLAYRRDLPRLVRLAGVRWVTARELVRILEDHDRIQVHGRDVRLPPGSEAVIVGGAESP